MVLKYQFPFPIEWYDPDDEFGNTRPPWRTLATPHRGSDFNKSSAGQSGTAIPAIAAGVVRYSGWYDGLGYMVSIQHPDGYFSGYCHMVSSPPVTIGATVSRGQIVGYIGGTAGPGDFSYAPHLHLTMGTDVNGTQGGASRFDPIPFIQARLNGDETPTPGDDMYDDAARAALYGKIETEGRPLKLYQYGTGLIVMGPGGKTWAIPSAAYNDLLYALGLTGRYAFFSVTSEQLSFMKQILRDISPDPAVTAQVNAVLNLSEEEASSLASALSEPAPVADAFSN